MQRCNGGLRSRYTVGRVSRKGSWEPPARLQVLALMGGVDIRVKKLPLAKRLVAG